MSHKIGITACSNPMHPSFSADLARLCQILRELGFDPVLSPCLYDNGSGFSGTGAERADALMNLYCDPEITDIFDVSGGDMANEVLPYLDFSVIAASGKRFWGYSDLTTIVNAVTTATGNESMLYQVRNLLYDHSAEQITLLPKRFFRAVSQPLRPPLHISAGRSHGRCDDRRKYPLFSEARRNGFSAGFPRKNPAPRSHGRRRSADGYVSVPAENDACL